MDMMIANLLYIIPMATSQSLFAEGSYSEKELKIQLKKAIKIISLILVPAIVLTLLFGKYIFLAFGKGYSTEGFVFLQIILVNFIGAFIILSLSTMLAYQNLLGMGIAWIIAQTIVAILYLILVRKLI